LCTRLNQILKSENENEPTRTIGDIQLRPGNEHEQQLFRPDFDLQSFDAMGLQERWATLVEHGKMNVLYVDYDMAGAESKQFSLFAAATGIPVDRPDANYTEPDIEVWTKFHEEEEKVRVFYADWNPETKTAYYREELLIPGASLHRDFMVKSRVQVVRSKSTKG
jgi:hypothetical protein